MKKHLLQILAITAAISFSAFTKKPYAGEELFRIKAGVDLTSASAVQDPTNWERIPIASASCYPSNTNDQACEIYVSNTYWSLDGNGVKVLNATDPDGAGTDQQMIIGSSAGQGSNKIVCSCSSTVVSVHNRDLP